MAEINATCKYCGIKFTAGHPRATFCTDRHRVEYSLISERIEKAAYRVLQDVALIQALYDQHPEFTDQARPLIETIIDRTKAARPRKAYTRRTPQVTP